MRGSRGLACALAEQRRRAGARALITLAVAATFSGCGTAATSTASAVHPAVSAPSPAGGAEATLAPIDRACATQLAPLRTVVASVYELYPQSLTPRGLQSAARAYAAAGVALRDLSRHVAREDPRSDVKSLSVELAVMARGFRVLADEVSRFGQGDAGASVIGGQAAIEQDAADLAPAARRLRLPACSPF